MRVFYDSRMVATVDSRSPSPGKPKLVVDDWGTHGVPMEIETFDPATSAEIEAVHDADYVLKVLDGIEFTGFGEPSKEVAQSCRWTCGSMIAAAHAAIETGIACSPSSGFHHAMFAESGPFCTFNGLMVAALDILDAGYPNIGRVGILDLDQHFGDGTHDIIERLEIQDHVCQVSGRHVGMQAEEVLEDIPAWIDELECDLLLYQAGADMYDRDPLGGLMDVEHLQRRDEAVFGHCRKRELPVAWNLAGGYSDMPTVLAIHRATVLAAIRAY